jgi:hypothetical protein
MRRQEKSGNNRMKRKRITAIGDRYEMTFVGFHRNHSDLGLLYHPSETSKARLAKVINKMFKDDKIKVFQNPAAPKIYKYEIVNERA